MSDQATYRVDRLRAFIRDGCSARDEDRHDALYDLDALAASLAAAVRERDGVLATLMPTVPQTYGEAIALYPWIGCASHEWDNRTTPENAVYLLDALRAKLREAEAALREISGLPGNAGRNAVNIARAALQPAQGEEPSDG